MRTTLVAGLAATTSALQLGTLPMAPRSAPIARSSPLCMQSLAEQMFGDVFKGIKSGVDKVGKAISQEEESPAAPPPRDGDTVASDLDMRAQSGDLNFDDFLTMASAYSQLGDDSVKGVLPGQLTPSELAETRLKFAKHEKIVEVMLDEERANPDLLVEAVKEGGSTPGPRLQRLAVASGEPETEIALFIMQVGMPRDQTVASFGGRWPAAVAAHTCVLTSAAFPHAALHCLHCSASFIGHCLVNWPLPASVLGSLRQCVRALGALRRGRIRMR